MAEFRTPFFRSFLVNEPELVRRVLVGEPAAFPKSRRVTRGLEKLLGRSVFVTGGETWARQRRIIDPAFDGGRLGELFPAMSDAVEAALGRLGEGEFEAEAWSSRLAADIIFRTLFSTPIEEEMAAKTYRAFRAYSRAQPVLTASALLPWLPVWHGRKVRRAARDLRGLLGRLVDARAEDIAAGRAPDDLATRIMTASDPETGACFNREETLDQIAIFFFAGHETSASAIGWTLYCLACDEVAQERVANEVAGCAFGDPAALRSLTDTRNAVREALRLYPPVPMMVREATGACKFRGRSVPGGAQVVVSPWYLHRHRDLWREPDAFCPERWNERAGRESFLPFSLGPRACPGAGFAMAEVTLAVARVVNCWRLAPVAGADPVPVAHLTLRAKDGIRIGLTKRSGG